MFEGFEHRRIDTGEVTINCMIGGKGPPLLLLHGYPQNLALWARVAPRLGDRFSVVCADLRGYGDSAKPEGLPDHANYAFRALAADQVTLMRALGFDRFHVVGHDRGGRTAHRMALDHPDAVLSLAVLDIAPTHAAFTQCDRHLAGTYWHWFFLSQPAPLPERMIGADPDFFFESCFGGWGGAGVASLDPEMLADYRRYWRDPAMIHASCCDYRAAASIDLLHDEADLATKVACPTLAFWGSQGAMHRLFDLKSLWQQRCIDVHAATLPGGHFFIDQFPEETAGVLAGFLESVAAR